jgi:hypothetical protein
LSGEGGDEMDQSGEKKEEKVEEKKRGGGGMTILGGMGDVFTVMMIRIKVGGEGENLGM